MGPDVIIYIYSVSILKRKDVHMSNLDDVGLQSFQYNEVGNKESQSQICSHFCM